jgi:hypothetical protein
MSGARLDAERMPAGDQKVALVEAARRLKRVLAQGEAA